MVYQRHRTFNRVWRIRRFIIQTMLSNFQPQHFALRLIPSVTVAHSNKMALAVGLDWIFGCVNIGWMRHDFVEAEDNRLKRVESEAAKLGITVKQQTMRWDGY